MKRITTYLESKISLPTKLQKIIDRADTKTKDWNKTDDTLMDMHVSLANYYNDENNYNLVDKRYYDKHDGVLDKETAGEFNTLHIKGINNVFNMLTNEQKKDWIDNHFYL